MAMGHESLDVKKRKFHYFYLHQNLCQLHPKVQKMEPYGADINGFLGYNLS